MNKFKIIKFDVTSECCSSPVINMTIAARPDISHEDLSNLRAFIECGTPDSVAPHVFCGRGNGKTKYFYDWMWHSLNAEASRFEIKNVIFNNPATIVFWADGTKTVVQCQPGDEFIPETGLAMCFMKRALGNKSNFNNTFRKHISISEKIDVVDKPKKKHTKTYAHLDSEAIYRILRENKSSVAELANSVGVDKTTVYGWLRGGGIKKRNISKLIKVLHVSEGVIIKEEN